MPLQLCIYTAVHNCIYTADLFDQNPEMQISIIAHRTLRSRHTKGRAWCLAPRKSHRAMPGQRQRATGRSAGTRVMTHDRQTPGCGALTDCALKATMDSNQPRQGPPKPTTPSAADLETTSKSMHRSPLDFQVGRAGCLLRVNRRTVDNAGARYFCAGSLRDFGLVRTIDREF